MSLNRRLHIRDTDEFGFSYNAAKQIDGIATDFSRPMKPAVG